MHGRFIIKIIRIKRKKNRPNFVVTQKRAAKKPNKKTANKIKVKCTLCNIAEAFRFAAIIYGMFVAVYLFSRILYFGRSFTSVLYAVRFVFCEFLINFNSLWLRQYKHTGHIHRQPVRTHAHKRSVCVCDMARTYTVCPPYRALWILRWITVRVVIL